MMLEKVDGQAQMLPQGDKGSASRGVALVTGARRGIGRAICAELARNGFDIAMIDIVEDDLSRQTLDLVAELGRRVWFRRHDIAQSDANADVLSSIEAELGAINCLVNNAGIQVSARGDLLDVTEQEFDRLININLRGTFFLTQAVARRMTRRAVGESVRSVITITSANAHLVSPEKGPYCVSKVGLSMAMQQFAVRLARDNIYVHEIRPGLIQTDMTADVFEKYDPEVRSGRLGPVGRWGQPEDIAKAVSSLAIGAMPFSTGDIYNIGGGLHIQRL